MSDTTFNDLLDSSLDDMIDESFYNTFLAELDRPDSDGCQNICEKVVDNWAASLPSSIPSQSSEIVPEQVDMPTSTKSSTGSQPLPEPPAAPCEVASHQLPPEAGFPSGSYTFDALQASSEEPQGSRAPAMRPQLPINPNQPRASTRDMAASGLHRVASGSGSPAGGGLLGASLRGRGRGRGKAPTASALAQRRYHERQKEKRAVSEKQLAELTEQLEELMHEKQELQLKERILLDRLNDAQGHLEEMFGNKAVRTIQQTQVLGATAVLIGDATGGPVSLEASLKWTLQEYIDIHFQAFMARCAELCPAALKDSSSPENAELCRLMAEHKALDGGGLSSCIHWGLLSWNMQETRKRPLPDTAFWSRILEGLMLSRCQEDHLLSAFRRLHSDLRPIAEARRGILSQLGMEALSFPRDEMHKCAASNLLYKNFRAEQTAVIGFFLLTEQVLSQAQEAALDCFSYPWCPEWLTLCTLLAARRGQAPLVFPDLGTGNMDCPVLPYQTAFEVLAEPITALGIGKRLRKGIILCPFETVLSASCFPHAPQDRLSKMRLLDVMLGNWRQHTCWEWMTLVRKLGRIVPNPLIEEGSDKESCGIFLPASVAGHPINNFSLWRTTQTLPEQGT